jgi:putative ABC transport system permease protein
MPSLALLTFLREWKRFAPAICTVGFSGLLVLAQCMLMLGVFRSFAVYIDGSDADLWVGYPDAQSVEEGRNIPLKTEVFLRQHPEVAAVEPFFLSEGDARRPDNSPVEVALVGVETRGRPMVLQRMLTDEQRRALEEPGTVLVDESQRENLGVEVGGTLAINGRRVRVVGFTRGLASIGEANVVGSLLTVRELDASLRATEEVGYLLVRLRDPARAEIVRDALAPSGRVRAYSVWTAREFSNRTQLYWLAETGIGVALSFGGIIGLGIGIVIVGQTLRGLIRASLPELATLRALGVPIRSLRLIVLEQSFWIGVVGLAITLACAYGLERLATSAHILVSAPFWVYAGTTVFVMSIALFSGLFAMRTLRQAEPADLLH